MKTPIVNDETVADDLPEAPGKRARRNFGRGEMPDRPPMVVEVTLAGKPALKVELFGRIADRLPEEDRFMMVDAEDWPRIEALSPWWALVSSGGGSPFVGRGTANMARVAKQSEKSHPNATLARVVLKASKAQRVVCGNPLDLRKASLALVDSHGEVGAFYRSVREFTALLNLQ